MNRHAQLNSDWTEGTWLKYFQITKSIHLKSRLNYVIVIYNIKFIISSPWKLNLTEQIKTPIISFLSIEIEKNDTPKSRVLLCILFLNNPEFLFIQFMGLAMRLRGRASRLWQAKGPGASATWPILSLWYIWDPCTKLIERGVNNRSLGNYLNFSTQILSQCIKMWFLTCSEHHALLIFIIKISQNRKITFHYILLTHKLSFHQFRDVSLLG